MRHFSILSQDYACEGLVLDGLYTNQLFFHRVCHKYRRPDKDDLLFRLDLDRNIFTKSHFRQISSCPVVFPLEKLAGFDDTSR